MEDAPKYQVEMVALERLKPAPYNPRTLTQHQFESLQRSIDEFGFIENVVANRRSGNIVGGHQRVAAARAMGIKEVPVIWVDVDDAHEKSLNIGLNKIGGEFDNDMLAEMLINLDDELTSLTGFTDEEIAKLQDGWADETPDEPKPEKDKPKSYTKELLNDFAQNYSDPEAAKAFIQWLP